MNGAHVSERDLRLFLVLDAVLAERSVTRAAARLGVTQSAVSHSLRSLRSRLGDPLLVRTPTGLEPTPLAQSLRPDLRSGLDALERLLRHQQHFDPATSTRSFSLATPDHPQFTMIPEFIGYLRQTAPGVDVCIRAIGPGLPEEMASGRLDLVLAGAEAEGILGLDREVMRQRVIDEPFRCLLRRGHPALARPLDLQAYVALPHVLVSTTGGKTGIVDEALAVRGLRRRVAVTVPSFPAAAYIVASSDLIATLPQAVAERAERLDVELRPPPLELPRGVAYLWWHPRFQHDPGHTWWRRALAGALSPFRCGDA
ncbi:LysR family transcriptional regulator [Lichenicoccus roseus]|nr:LysR family transcriptional regulator [Lichenicoccus roseus]